jgi:hypothetical protein
MAGWLSASDPVVNIAVASETGITTNGDKGFSIALSVVSVPKGHHSLKVLVPELQPGATKTVPEP